MIEGVDAPRSGRVVPWRLVGEGGKAERIGIHQRRRESPCIMQSFGGRIMVFHVVQVTKLSGEIISGVFIIFVLMFGTLIERHHDRCLEERVW